MKNIKIYRCNICGNIILKLKDASEALVCCNQPMNLLVANVDGAKEKHLPIITAKTNHSLTIQIGSTVHPMTAEHYIEWIATFSDKGWNIKWLTPQSEPTVTFNDVNPNEIFCYCNIHGLWKNN